MTSLHKIKQRHDARTVGGFGREWLRVLIPSRHVIWRLSKRYGLPPGGGAPGSARGE